MPLERQRAHVLVVDDDTSVQRFSSALLEHAGHSCRVAQSAFEARRLMGAEVPELALCDINLPGESGLELARHIRRSHPDTAVVMMSGLDDPGTVDAALELGVYGYIVKPFTASELEISVLNALRRRRLEIESRARQEELEAAVLEQTAALRETVERLERAQRETRRAQIETIRRLAGAVEYRDADTGKHIERMSHLAGELALAAGLGEERSQLIRLASLLHDIGKIAIPDSILLKRGPLTRSEREVMRRHADIGYRMLSGSDIEVLSVAATIAWTHHERFDGTGYPRGLSGEDIPAAGRVVAIADVFDALTSTRPYRPAFSTEDAIEIMRLESGAQFDPELLDTFFQLAQEVSGSGDSDPEVPAIEPAHDVSRCRYRR